MGRRGRRRRRRRKGGRWSNHGTQPDPGMNLISVLETIQLLLLYTKSCSRIGKCVLTKLTATGTLALELLATRSTMDIVRCANHSIV